MVAGAGPVARRQRLVGLLHRVGELGLDLLTRQTAGVDVVIDPGAARQVATQDDRRLGPAGIGLRDLLGAQIAPADLDGLVVQTLGRRVVGVVPRRVRLGQQALGLQPAGRRDHVLGRRGLRLGRGLRTGLGLRRVLGRRLSGRLVPPRLVRLARLHHRQQRDPAAERLPAVELDRADPREVGIQRAAVRGGKLQARPVDLL